MAQSEMKRLAAYLPDPIYEELEKWADVEKRSLSNLVGYLLEASVRERLERANEDQTAATAK
jgi:hypothetical protein